MKYQQYYISDFFVRKLIICFNFLGSWINRSGYYDNLVGVKVKI